MNKLRMIQGRPTKSAASSGGTNTLFWNRCSYQVPVMVETNDSTNDKHKFYNVIVQ